LVADLDQLWQCPLLHVVGAHALVCPAFLADIRVIWMNPECYDLWVIRRLHDVTVSCSDVRVVAWRRTVGTYTADVSRSSYGERRVRGRDGRTVTWTGTERRLASAVLAECRQTGPISRHHHTPPTIYSHSPTLHGTALQLTVLRDQFLQYFQQMRNTVSINLFEIYRVSKNMMLVFPKFPHNA